MKNFSLIPEYQKGLIAEEIVEKYLEFHNYSVRRPNYSEKNLSGIVDFICEDYNFKEIGELVYVSFQSPKFYDNGKFQTYTFPKKQIETLKKSLNENNPILCIYIVDEKSENIFCGQLDRLDIDGDIHYSGFDNDYTDYHQEYISSFDVENSGKIYKYYRQKDFPEYIFPFDVEYSNEIYRYYYIKLFHEAGKIDFSDLEKLRLINFSDSDKKIFKLLHNLPKNISVENLLKESQAVISKYLGIELPEDLSLNTVDTLFKNYLEQKIDKIPTCFFYEIYHALHNINIQFEISDFAMKIYNLLDEIKHHRQKYSSDVEPIEIENSAEKIFDFKSPNGALLEILEVENYTPKFFISSIKLAEAIGCEKGDGLRSFSSLGKATQVKSNFYKLLNSPLVDEYNSKINYVVSVKDISTILSEYTFNRVDEISKYETAIKFLDWWKEIEKNYFGAKAEVNFLPDKYTAYFWEKIDSSEPTDIIKIHSEDESINLLEKWNTSTDEKSFQIPADIFLEETIPIYDFVLKYEYANDERFKLNPIYRFIVFRDFGNQLYKSDDENFVCVGMIVANFEIDSKFVEIANPFSVDKNNLSVKNEAFICCREITPNRLNKLPSSQFNFLIDSFKSVLIDWYGIQNALLNPVAVEQIRNRQKKSQNFSNVAEYHYRKNNKVAYIKRIPIFVEDLIVGEKRKYEIQADKWGVLGHWRTYANGKKSWIKPYEKGPKRGQKLEKSDQRERIIVNK